MFYFNDSVSTFSANISSHLALSIYVVMYIMYVLISQVMVMFCSYWYRSFKIPSDTIRRRWGVWPITEVTHCLPRHQMMDQWSSVTGLFTSNITCNKHSSLHRSFLNKGLNFSSLSSDLLQNPLIVPVKVLRGHAITHDLGVLDVTFHPTQPWVFSSGADATIRLFT